MKDLSLFQYSKTFYVELTENEITEKYGQHRGHCNRDTLLPYEYEFTGVSGGFNLIKRKHELSKIQRKKINFINRLKHAEHKMFCICVDVYQTYEGNGYDKLYEIISLIKKKLKIKKPYLKIIKISSKIVFLNKFTIQEQLEV